MPETTKIEKTFTYNIADAYLYQTAKLKKTAEWTYSGPDKIWVFVNNDTGKILGKVHYTERDNGADIPTPENETKVLIDANTNPLLASLFSDETDHGSLPQTLEELPEGFTYGHTDPIPPDHTYEVMDLIYDFTTQQFQTPYPWKQPHMDWEGLITARNSILKWSDMQIKLADDVLIPEWEIFRQKLRDIPTTFKNIDPWKIPFPTPPGE